MARFTVNKPAGSSLLEIGSAPGLNLIRVCRKFGYQPWGIEYSPIGAEANRATFRREGYPEANLIEGDVFDERLLRENENRFDIVYSAGLIEHFEDPRDLIARHVRLAAPGGFIVITVPNGAKTPEAGLKDEAVLAAAIAVLEHKAGSTAVTSSRSRARVHAT